MDFDYDAATKGAYRQATVASEYHAAFAGPLTLSRLRFRYVAGRERAAVRRLLSPLRARVVLDLPCGTGKLAPVFAEGGQQVVAVDVSPEMLAVARETYAAAGVRAARFATGDAESASSLGRDAQIDAVVSLRLMHRVPPPVRRTILRELAATAPYTLATFAIDSRFHRWRRRLRTFLFSAPQQQICAASLPDIRRELEEHFTILRFDWIARFLSEEAIFLLRSKTRP